LNKSLKDLFFVAVLVLVMVGLFNVCAQQCRAAMFTFENSSNNTVVMKHYWIDHKLDNWPFPFNIHGGEYGPGVIYVQQQDYDGHLFCLEVIDNTRTEDGNPIRCTRTYANRVHYTWDGENININEE